MASNALGLLGLGKRGGNVFAGEDPVITACRAGRARLVLVASDAGEHTIRRAGNLFTGPVIQVPYDKVALGAALGMRSCAVAALGDARLALSFVRKLDGDYASAIAVLEKITAPRLPAKQK
ncbi:MAG: hypothetical protein PHS97_00025 [Oscillospiraceae bacterium]|nr:hypothetical protein [Oscillospiraceae bacterium]